MANCTGCHIQIQKGLDIGTNVVSAFYSIPESFLTGDACTLEETVVKVSIARTEDGIETKSPLPRVHEDVEGTLEFKEVPDDVQEEFRNQIKRLTNKIDRGAYDIEDSNG
jgi:hypothetical protein